MDYLHSLSFCQVLLLWETGRVQRPSNISLDLQRKLDCTVSSDSKMKKNLESKSTFIQWCAHCRTNLSHSRRAEQTNGNMSQVNQFLAVQLLSNCSIAQIACHTVLAVCTYIYSRRMYTASLLGSHRRAEWQSITINNWWPCYSITDCVCVPWRLLQLKCWVPCLPVLPYTHTHLQSCCEGSDWTRLIYIQIIFPIDTVSV